MLVDNQGTVHYCQHNKVLVNDCIHDPTAHGERQIISWYVEQRKAGKPLPPPDQMIIITSLDSCVMCTGAFLASGINVAVISRDNQAGIDWTADQKFLGVPESIRNQAIRQFAYLGLAKGRPYAGSPYSIFNGASIPADLDSASSTAFLKSRPIVHRILDRENPEPLKIATLPPSSHQWQMLRKI